MWELAVLVTHGQAQVPVFEIIPVNSWIKFAVKSSTSIAGKFDKWDASLTFTSPNETTGTLELKIEAASVDTGRTWLSALFCHRRNSRVSGIKMAIICYSAFRIT
jgi:polyisoprenoid-binding protein YceI